MLGDRKSAKSISTISPDFCSHSDMMGGKLVLLPSLNGTFRNRKLAYELMRKMIRQCSVVNSLDSPSFSLFLIALQSYCFFSERLCKVHKSKDANSAEGVVSMVSRCRVVD